MGALLMTIRVIRGQNLTIRDPSSGTCRGAYRPRWINTATCSIQLFRQSSKWSGVMPFVYKGRNAWCSLAVSITEKLVHGSVW